ncbi:hypothetical protein FNF27_06822 [Cafeteria roenbergensis]|nr:hypothetical protein FNF27_06822 [Cafeteria roenbergensis]
MRVGPDTEVSYAFYPGSGAAPCLHANVLNVPIPPFWREAGSGRAAALQASRARKQYDQAMRAAQRERPGSLLLEGAPVQPGGTPLQPPRSGRHAFLAGMREKVLPALRAFGPDLIIISAGFDAGKADVGNTRNDGSADAGSDLLPEDYMEMTRMVLSVAQQCCPGRVVSLLEGGYGRWALREAPRASSAPLPHAPARRSSRRAAAVAAVTRAARMLAGSEPTDSEAAMEEAVGVAGEDVPTADGSAGGSTGRQSRRRSPRRKAGADDATASAAPSTPVRGRSGRQAQAAAAAAAAAADAGVSGGFVAGGGPTSTAESPAAERPRSAAAAPDPTAVKLRLASPSRAQRGAEAAEAGDENGSVGEESESEDSDAGPEPPALAAAGAGAEPALESTAPERRYVIERDVLAACCTAHLRAMVDGPGPVHRGPL